MKKKLKKWIDKVIASIFRPAPVPEPAPVQISFQNGNTIEEVLADFDRRMGVK